MGLVQPYLRQLAEHLAGPAEPPSLGVRCVRGVRTLLALVEMEPQDHVLFLPPGVWATLLSRLAWRKDLYSAPAAALLHHGLALGPPALQDALLGPVLVSATLEVGPMWRVMRWLGDPECPLFEQAAQLPAWPAFAAALQARQESIAKRPAQMLSTSEVHALRIERACIAPKPPMPPKPVGQPVVPPTEPAEEAPEEEEEDEEDMEEDEDMEETDEAESRQQEPGEVEDPVVLRWEFLTWLVCLRSAKNRWANMLESEQSRALLAEFSSAVELSEPPELEPDAAPAHRLARECLGHGESASVAAEVDEGQSGAAGASVEKVSKQACDTGARV